MDDKSRQGQTSTPEFKELVKKTRDKYLSEIGDNLIRNGIPERFREANLAQVSPGLAGKIDSSKSYFITGGVGTGKSYLMVAILREYLSKAKIFKREESLGYHLMIENLPFIFRTEYEMFQKIRDCYQRGLNEDELLTMLTNINLLCIDDFGTEPNKDWTSSKMFSIIDKRYGNNKQTIITSNHSLQYISENIDDRIASRIAEMCTIIELKTLPDRRLKGVKKIKI